MVFGVAIVNRTGVIEMPVQPLPDDSPYLTPDKLRAFAVSMRSMTWRQAIECVWTEGEPPRKADLREHINQRYGGINSFCRVWNPGT